MGRFGVGASIFTLMISSPWCLFWSFFGLGFHYGAAKCKEKADSIDRELLALDTMPMDIFLKKIETPYYIRFLSDCDENILNTNIGYLWRRNEI